MKLIWFILIFILISCGQKEISTEVWKKPVITISTDKESYVAGDSVSLDVSLVESNDSIDVQLLVTHSHGESVYPYVLSAGDNKIIIDPNLTQKRGHIFTQILSEGHPIGQKQLSIKPRDPYNLVESYSGPATIESSGIDWHLVTAIVKDEFDNPVADGTPVSFTIRYPDGYVRRVNKKVEKLLNGVRIDATTKAGKIFTGIKSETAHSVEREVLVTPTWPNPFQLEIIDYLPFAEQRQVLKLRTSIIRDRYGNTIADGTTINFEIKDEDDLISNFVSYSVSGRGEVQIENPDKATFWEIFAYVDQSNRSNILNLSFDQSIREIPISYDSIESQLVFGPVLGPLEQFVANGVILSFELKPINAKEWNTYKGELIHGYYYWNIPMKSYVSGSYECKAYIGGLDSHFSFIYTNPND